MFMKLLLATVFALVLTSQSARALDFDANVPADLKTQMLQDLDFMKTVRGDKVTPLHQQIYGTMAGGYGDWFTSRVQSVGLNDCGSPIAVACVIPFQDPSKMWLTNNYTKFDHPQIARLMVVYHEARHTESQSGNWMHATCPDPFLDAQGHDMKSIWTGAALAGQDACDSTPFGSYGSSTILLKNVALNCKNCSDKVKMDAGLYSDDQLGRIIDANSKAQMQADFASLK
jgi:hypothetical protein